MKMITWGILLCLMTACGSGGTGNEDLSKEAQQAFAEGNYEDALNIFLSLAESEPVTGYTGAGWSAVRLHDYANANVYFQTIAASNDADAYAGWSLTGWALSDFNSAIQRADTVLSKDADFVLKLDDGVAAADLILVQALCYYETNNFSMTLQKIKLIDSGFNADLNGSDIAQVLAAKLEQLSVLFSKTLAKGQ
ncbi:MAG TPA: hypothetical protein PLH27_01910 [bacterium]|nr:hypothetical protein [bacterium]HMW34934.1 hypothetical protein [bacterium]HMY34654.1 hypothetical protein [bacterium]HMZ04083.1 hypothetical protein [bacterium]HNB09044.1 hypothetical protein [bacterium]